MPQLVGATRSEGGRSPGQRGCFSEVQERIVCVLAKGEPPICEGKPKPGGLELPSAGAERGNYPEAKPKREGHERQTCMHNRELFSLLAEDADALPSNPTAVVSRRSQNK